MKSRKSIGLLRGNQASLLLSIVVFTNCLITGCSKPVKPDEVYCLVSSDELFYEDIRAEVRAISNKLGFSYYDTSQQVWNDMSGNQSGYDPRRFIDVLVKNNDSYALMINSIGEPDGRVRVSVFRHHNKNIEDFSRMIKHAFLSGAPDQKLTSLERCSN